MPKCKGLEKKQLSFPLQTLHNALVYFNSKGRGEVARFLFLQAGVEFEDDRVVGQEEWKEMKPTLLMQALPILEVDNEQITGSGPINKHATVIV